MPHGEMCPREQEDVRAWPRGPLGRGRVGGAGLSGRWKAATLCLQRCLSQLPASC